MSTVYLRRVPVESPVHSLWAGTKLIAVFAVSVVLMFIPTWPVLAFVAVAMLATSMLARIPLGALPRPPWWFWGLVAMGAVITVPVGVDAVDRYAQIVVFGFLLILASMMIAWTTPMNEIAPAIATLGAPLRKLRLPVDEWAVAVALCLRSLPLLFEEIRLLRAGHRLRPKHRVRGSKPLTDIITAVMVVAMRRAGELGEAITARGGTGQLAAYPSRPGRSDAVALVLVAALCAVSVVLATVI